MSVFKRGSYPASETLRIRRNGITSIATKCLLRLSAISVALSFTVAFGQSAPSSLDVPQPVASGALGHADVGASTELVAHLKAVGLATWTGMQGTGQINYGDDTAAYSATVTILGSSKFRLDAQTQHGQFSIRISGRRGRIQEADGHQTFILPNTAATGLFQFQLLRLADFPAPQTSLLDRGSVVVDGKSLHRLTFEFSAPSPSPLNQKRGIIATDLYFDPSTHLLVKSANAIQIDRAGNQDFLREITYEDYRQVDGILIPFRYTQTFNGQKLWTLQLSDVQLNPSIQATYFEF